MLKQARLVWVLLVGSEAHEPVQASDWGPCEVQEAEVEPEPSGQPERMVNSGLCKQQGRELVEL